jgi:hypothetical protein
MEINLSLILVENKFQQCNRFHQNFPPEKYSPLLGKQSNISPSDNNALIRRVHKLQALLSEINKTITHAVILLGRINAA